MTTTPASPPRAASSIGRSVVRKEGRDKVTGAARYIDDMAFPGCLHGVTVRSAIARGKIREIKLLPGVPWDEITVVTAKDIPGENHVALIMHDQPFLADGVVNHADEPVVLLAHPDRHVVEEARRRVEVVIDPLPPVLTIDDALSKKQVIWGEDNVFKTYLVEKGLLDAQWARAAHVIEGVYETGAQEQLYIENNGVVAVANADGVTIWGSMQCPYYVHKGLAPLWKDLAPEKLRIIQAETGGGFGGKEEYPTLVAGHAALLSQKAGGKAVKIIYDRAEDMAATTKRHPSRTKHRWAVAADGKILGMDVVFEIDGGAYCTLSPVVLSRGTIHACGPYRIDNLRVRSAAFATNHPPHGAFRGFGAPQSIFALERHMEKVARAVGLTSEELRRRNFVHEGETLATGQIVREKVDMEGLLTRTLAAAGYHEKRARFARENALPGATVKRGIGFACFMHGSGFTGSGETYLASKVGVEGTPEGKVRVLVASTEIGQGTNTVLAQIAADALGIDYEAVECLRPDTAYVPNSGPTVASRTTMVVGHLVENAAKALAQTLVASGDLPCPGRGNPSPTPPAEGSAPFTTEDLSRAIKGYRERVGELKAMAQYQAPPGVRWDDKTYSGDAYGTYAWAVYTAEVAVDTTSYEARCTDFVAAQEIGRVIHPVMAAGQIEGGVAQGVGYALYENVVYKDGRVINNQMTNYIMPTAADVPRIRVLFEETPYAFGPGGAKGIGELPMDGPAPAIANAIEEALGAGAGLDGIPLVPERIMEAVEARRGDHEPTTTTTS